MRVWITVSVLFLVACGTSGAPALPIPGSLPAGASALADPGQEGLPEPLIPIESLRPGGPPPDGIPSIDEPRFRSIGEADPSLADSEPVVVVEIDGDVRAYPVEILMWHEIVNDIVGGVPIAVTYCPLCNSAVTFRRTVNDVDVTFGTSGLLFASALVMYDRATESLWTHFDGRAVAGVLTGQRLEPVPSPLLSWAEFTSAFPDARVLSRDTGFTRPYGQNPYYGYDAPDTRPFFLRGELDDRLRVKERVVGVDVDGESIAFVLADLRTDDVSATEARVGSTHLVVFWRSGQNSALEDADTSVGRDVGSVGVFMPSVDGRTLSFGADGGRIVDLETGSTWDVTGRAIDGPMEGSRLERLPHLDTFWFAWSRYHPDTRVQRR